MKKIDIHVHSTLQRGMLRLRGDTYTTPEELRARYDRLGIEFGVNLPVMAPECAHCYITNEEAYQLTKLYPETYTFFCNIDPRMGFNSPETNFSTFINYYKSLGAKGIGEVTALLYFDDPRVLSLFSHAEKCDMPLTFHIGSMVDGDYGLVDELGLPRLEKVLAQFPRLTFLGHSQKFWGEISGDLKEEDRNEYPSGPVAPGGRIEYLMDRYPNLHGDLSAGSGYNALTRDPEYGYYFIQKFQDRLYFGTDICSPNDDMQLSFWLDEAVERGKISQSAYEKVGRLNAIRLLKL